jgi:hypothetical protein
MSAIHLLKHLFPPFSSTHSRRFSIRNKSLDAFHALELPGPSDSAYSTKETLRSEIDELAAVVRGKKADDAAKGTPLDFQTCQATKPIEADQGAGECPALTALLNRPNAPKRPLPIARYPDPEPPKLSEPVKQPDFEREQPVEPKMAQCAVIVRSNNPAQAVLTSGR